jgi:uncharacterized protein YlaI
MGAFVKTVNCLNCKKEMKIKTLRLNPGKYIFGRGYVCDECLKKAKDAEKEKKATVKKDGK